MIKVYTISNCPWCSKVKSYLDKKGVSYEEINIGTNEEAQAECERISGGLTVPVTTNGNLVAVSFKKSIIDKMIDLE